MTELNKKVKCLLLSFAPLALLMIVQGIVLYGVQLLQRAAVGSSAFMAFLQSQSGYLVSVFSYGLFLIPGFYWYRNVTVMAQGNGAKRNQGLTKKEMTALLTAGLCLQLGVDMLLYLLNEAAPEIMVQYGEVMDSLGVTEPSVLSAAYVILLAPLAEELLMRGLCLGILKRAFPFWAANILQALYFAILHMNLVQGGYAFLAGLLFGSLLRKYKTLKAPVICHFAVNLSGQIISILNPAEIYKAAAFPICILFLLFLYKKEKNY